VKTNGAAAHDEFAKMQTNTFYHKIVQTSTLSSESSLFSAQ